MNNKIYALIFTLLISIIGSSFAEGKPKQKDKNKEKAVKAAEPKSTESKTAEIKGKEAKITEIKGKEAKALEIKEPEKTMAAAKADTSKIKQDHALTQTDSLELYLANSKLKFLKKSAHASYYHNRFNGRRTASGKKFNNNGYTAAHKKLPFGTKVKVTNESNGKYVIVEITDRGPFSKAREIDLSRRAFMDIVSNKNSGSAIVTIEVLEPKK